MLVRCVNLGGNELRGADLAFGNTRLSKFHVALNRTYNVYGVSFIRGVTSYLIIDDTNLPSWSPGVLFSVEDGALSRHWRYYDYSNADGYFSVLMIPELGSTPEKFDRIALAEDSDARRLFFEYAAILDLEFPNDAIKEKCGLVENGWIQCPFCANVWCNSCLDAMATCPDCGRTSHNPAYVRAV